MPLIRENSLLYEVVKVSTVDGIPLSVATPTRTPTTTSVASSTSSATLVAANSNRRGLSINNQSTSNLYLSFSATATVANSFLVMSPSSFLLLDQQLITTNAITGLWSVANGTAQITEFI